MTLTDLGWNSAWADVFRQHARDEVVPARIMIRHNHVYTVAAERGGAVAEVPAECAGRLKHQAAADELPAVGDWAAVQMPKSDGVALIHAVLPRRSKFSRKVAGRGNEEQVVAANADTVLLIAGLDNDFSPRRIERYLVAAWESGAAPVVVLNKADLCADVSARVAEIAEVAIGVPVHVMSALHGDGIDALSQYLGSGKTIALLGSSGVGKSTLINRMIGSDALATQPVRDHDSRGRHTTTHRQLIVLPKSRLATEGGLVIDTPGMRELQLWDADEGLQVTFDEIQTLASGCRFDDCSHQSEPGCAVRAAVEDGSLAAERLASYHKMQRELAWLERRQDTSAAAVEKKRWKAIHKAQRDFYKR